MEKTLKEKIAEKTSEILGEKKITYILKIIEAYEEAKRIVTREEALELTQRFAHELPGVVDFKN